jgi:hypothetical protein
MIALILSYFHPYILAFIALFLLLPIKRLFQSIAALGKRGATNSGFQFCSFVFMRLLLVVHFNIAFK